MVYPLCKLKDKMNFCNNLPLEEDWVKLLFESNKTCHRVSPLYEDSKMKRIFVIACLWRKLDYIRKHAHKKIKKYQVRNEWDAFRTSSFFGAPPPSRSTPSCALSFDLFLWLVSRSSFLSLARLFRVSLCCDVS